MQALELLSGDAQSFLDKVWAQRVLVHEPAAAELAALLTLDDVDRLLTGSGLRTPAVRVVRDGSVCASSSFTRAASISGVPLSGLVDTRRALALYDQGATIVLQGLHRYWPPLIDFVRRLEFELGHPCQANAYLTPPGSQGFARHVDSHDVFVVGTFGRKNWHIAAHADADTAGGGVERQVVVRRGVSVYLPAGTPHWALTEQDASLHVTIGINRLTWRALIRQSVDRILDDERFAAAAPAGYLDAPELLGAALAEQLEAVATRLRDADPAVTAQQIADDFLTGRAPALPGAFVDRSALPRLDRDTVLQRRASAACVLRPGPDRLRVLTGDRELRMPPWLGPAMEFVRDTDRFTVADLATLLGPQDGLVLCRRLVREGVLRVVS